MASRVADILLAQGRQAVDAAGRGWGAGLEQAGQVIGAGAQQFQENKARKQRLDLDTAHLGLLQKEEADRAAEAQVRADERAKQQLGDAVVTKAVQEHTTIDPLTGHHTTDHNAVVDDVTGQGFRTHAEHYMTFAPKQEEMNNQIQTDYLALEDKKNKWRLNIFGDIPEAPEEDRADLYTKRLASLPDLAKNDPVLSKLPPVYPGHQAMGSIVEGFRTEADRVTQRKTAAAEKLAAQKEKAAEDKAAAVEAETARKDRETAEARAATARREDAALAERIRAGKATEAETARFHREEATRAVKKAEEDKLTKVEDKDPETGRARIRWLPKSALAGQTFQKPTGATTETRLASAQAVNQTGEDIIKQLSDPKIAAKIGPAMGRFNSLRELIGNPPPELSEIAGSIESYSLANMGVHGMRSAQGAEQIKKLLDQKHTPESLIAAIRGLNKFSNHFMENEGRGATGGGPSAPANDIRVGGTFNGRKILKVEPVP